MIIRLLCLFLLAVATMAGPFSANWPAGKSEKLDYDMTIYVPSEITNHVHIEITKSTGPAPAFTLVQTLDVPSQSMKVKTTEKYRAEDMKFISSENFFKLPPEAVAQLGTDSILITAKAVKDSIEIVSSSPIIPSGTLYFPANLTTSVGAALTSRNSEFKTGTTRKFNMVNFISFTGQPVTVFEEGDSVLTDTTITTPAGTFKCAKVRSLGDVGAINFTYYCREKNNLPVMFEATDPSSGKPVAKLVLQKIE
ncbi:MAG: hypothetical protein NT002_02170 [candidate division Zixibacteria bacterium]|nr:hypothetical protein [candidate division Zixibacteria bacterium]